MSTLPAFTVFDLETTGLDPRKGHKVVEVAGVRVEDGKIMEEASFTEFVNHERDIPWEAKQVKKIADEDVASARTIDLVLPDFLQFAGASILVAHNADFDMGFLEAEKELCWGYMELPECLCTMRLSRSLHPEEFRHNLDVLSARYGVKLPSERHRALPDVMLTATILLKLIEEGNVATIDQLREMCGAKMAA